MFLLMLSLFVQAVAAGPQNWLIRTFEDDKIGTPPAGFAMAVGRDAAIDGWSVRREGAGKVLVHQGRPSPPDGFAVAILSGAQYHDVQVSVRLKATSGSRLAGVVWKYQDPLNHYMALLDLVKQDLVLYRVSRGNRIRLEREDDLEVDPEAWHSLKIFQEDGVIRVYLGGIRVFGERDRQHRGAPSGVGVWSAGDATVMFDDFRVEDEAEPPTKRASRP